jgi:hypothetical protein
MELDKEGKRINEFSPDVPYELGAGSFLDVPDGLKQGMRFHKSVICFSGVPFDHLKSILPGELQRTLKILEKWDSPYLKEHGEKVKLDRWPSIVVVEDMFPIRAIVSFFHLGI